jgi:hypothetical protein
MTISTTLISQVSKFTVGQGDFTSALYTELVTEAQAILDHQQNIGNMPVSLYDRCHALLVCHLYLLRDPAMGLNSYSAGDYSQSISGPGTFETGTAYAAQYLSIIKMWTQQNLPQTLTEVRRADSSMLYAKLDGNAVEDPWTGL